LKASCVLDIGVVGIDVMPLASNHYGQTCAIAMGVSDYWLHAASPPMPRFMGVQNGRNRNRSKMADINLETSNTREASEARNRCER
jgi:hypothetical protein